MIKNLLEDALETLKRHNINSASAEYITWYAYPDEEGETVLFNTNWVDATEVLSQINHDTNDIVNGPIVNETLTIVGDDWFLERYYVDEELSQDEGWRLVFKPEEFDLDSECCLEIQHLIDEDDLKEKSVEQNSYDDFAQYMLDNSEDFVDVPDCWDNKIPATSSETIPCTSNNSNSCLNIIDLFAMHNTRMSIPDKINRSKNDEVFKTTTVTSSSLIRYLFDCTETKETVMIDIFGNADNTFSYNFRFYRHGILSQRIIEISKIENLRTEIGSMFDTIKNETLLLYVKAFIG